MKKILCSIVCALLLLGGTTKISAVLPSNGKVLAMTALAGLAVDGALRGKKSWGYRKAVGAKDNMKALFQWAKSAGSLKEKLGDIKAHFGRNWIKYALLFTFVVIPLIRKYRVDPDWLKRGKYRLSNDFWYGNSRVGCYEPFITGNKPETGTRFDRAAFFAALPWGYTEYLARHSNWIARKITGRSY